MTAGTYDRMYAVVRRIPRGRVATYGQVATLAGLPGRARQVGYALAALEDDRIPWHRVVNARGQCSLRSDGDDHGQQRRLEAEGIVFDDAGRLDLARWRWRPRRGRGST